MSALPFLLKSVDEIMDEEKRDMFFIDFSALHFDGDAAERASSREEHLAWFRRFGLRYVPAAPRGWLEGDPGCFAVYFDGTGDNRVADYASQFENADGLSLKPDCYQMQLLTYQSWLDHDGPGYLARSGDIEW